MSIQTNLDTQVSFTIFRRLRVYLKNFKRAFFTVVTGMIGYLAIDVAVVAQLTSKVIYDTEHVSNAAGEGK